jgi:hypothetical protein
LVITWSSREVISREPRRSDQQLGVTG